MKSFKLQNIKIWGLIYFQT